MKKKINIFVVVCLYVCLLMLTGCNGVSQKNGEITVIRAGDDSSEEGTDDGTYVIGEEKNSETPTEQTEADETSRDENNEDDMIYVYLCGAVCNEDVYAVPPGSRVNDVLKMAGGFREGAANQYVNLAKEVTDGEKIYIPYADDIEKDMVGELIKNSGNSEESSSSENGQGLVNINTAGKDELMTLPGIGEGKAEDIIAYREQNGAFNSIEELMNVSGIKEGTFRKLKDKITL